MKKSMLKRVVSMLIVLMLAVLSMPICAASSSQDITKEILNYDELVSFGETCSVIDKDGVLWKWGWNGGGALGIGMSDTWQGICGYPQKVMNEVKSISSDGNMILKKDKTLWATGGLNPANYSLPFARSVSVPAKVLDNVVAVSGQMAIKTDKSLWSWGQSREGSITYNTVGNGTTTTQTVPVKIMDDVVSAYGNSAIKSDGSLWMWGLNNYCQLGEGVGDLSFPADSKEGRLGYRVQTTPIKMMDDVASVTIYNGSVAVIKNDGSLWMWGSNQEGVLGVGNQEMKSGVPRKVLDDVTSVFISGDRTAAIKKDCSLWMWGLNNYGQIGNNGEGNEIYKFNKNEKVQSIPVKVLDNVADVKLINGFTAALKYDGTVWTWGQSDIANSKVPEKKYDDVVDWVLNYFGKEAYIEILKSDGTLWTCGKNNFGQLGNGTTQDSSTLSKIMDDVVKIYEFAAIKADGSIWRWGNDFYGQVGYDPTSINSHYSYRTSITSPLQVPFGRVSESAIRTLNKPKSIFNFYERKTYTDGLFNDIDAESWYTNSIKAAYSLGIMNGKSPLSFDPDGNILISEAIKMASVVHNIYNGGTGEFAQGSPWYKVYVDYAIDNNIIQASDFADYNVFATREEMSYIFAHAIPSAELTAINNVKRLPDVFEESKYGSEIFMLYRAGVLTGNDSFGTFSPESTISRVQAAAIISRIAVPTLRKTVNLLPD